MLFLSSFFIFMHKEVTTDFFGEMMGEQVPKDMFLGFTLDQGNNAVNACTNLGVDIIKCNTCRLNSATI